MPQDGFAGDGAGNGNARQRRFERDGKPAEIDWAAAERSPEFQELVSRRRRFVWPMTAFFMAWYLGFIALVAASPDFMSESVYEAFTVGYALAFTQFLVTWVFAWLYVRKADREFEPLALRASERAVELSRREVRPVAGRKAAPRARPVRAREEVTSR
jgi:uncharacterized membrane protein (DUF485 family)